MEYASVVNHLVKRQPKLWNGHESAGLMLSLQKYEMTPWVVFEEKNRVDLARIWGAGISNFSLTVWWFLLFLVEHLWLLRSSEKWRPSQGVGRATSQDILQADLPGLKSDLDLSRSRECVLMCLL